MRIILSDFISLDGVVQAPGGQGEDDDGGFEHGGWSMPFFDEETMGPVLGEVMAQTEALLFGRRTWDTMASAWPDRAGDPFADQMNAIPKYVVSGTLTAEEASSRWNNTTLIDREDPIEGIRQLRSRPPSVARKPSPHDGLRATDAEGNEDGDGGIQVWGSSSLATQLVENDLVDEYRLMVEPILLGGGKTIFPRDGHARPLELVSVTPAKTGVLICAYRPAAA
jgi:dihydrofolate reductase